MLVVNVTWKNKTFIGTLLDSTKYKWAPPRLTDGDSETDNRKSKKKYTNTRSMIPGTTQSSQKRTTRRSKQAAMSSVTSLGDEGTKNTRGSKKQKNKTKKEKEAEKRAAEREQKKKEAQKMEEEAEKAAREEKSGREKELLEEQEMKGTGESDENTDNLAKKVVAGRGKKTSQRSNTPTKNNDEDYNPKGSGGTKRYKAKDYKEENNDESGSNGGKKRKGAKNDSKQESKKPKRGPTPTAEKSNGEKSAKDSGTPGGSSLPPLHKFDEKTGVKIDKSEKIKEKKEKNTDEKTASHKSEKSEKSHKSDKHKSDKHKSDKHKSDTEKGSGSDKLSGEKNHSQKSDKNLENNSKTSKNTESTATEVNTSKHSKEKTSSPVVPMPALHRAPVEDKMDTDEVEDKSSKKGSMPPPNNQCLPPSPSNNDSVNSPAKRVSPAYSDISDASNSPTPVQQEIIAQNLVQKTPGTQKLPGAAGIQIPQNQIHQKLAQNSQNLPKTQSSVSPGGQGAQTGPKNGVGLNVAQKQQAGISNISPKSGGNASNGFGPPPKLQSAPPKPVQNKPGMPGQKSIGPGNYQKPMPVKPNTMHQQKPQFPQQNSYKRPVNGDVFQVSYTNCWICFRA